jgi:gliding motility associated protien GldN
MKKISVIFLGLIVWSTLSIAQENAEENVSTTPTTTGEAEAEGTSTPGTNSSHISTVNGIEDKEGFNKYSTRPIHESDIMYQKTILRAIDLREKQNKPMFSRNKEITKLILEAVERGDIKPYATDSLEEGRTLTIDEFKESIKIPSETAELTEEDKAIALQNGDSSVLTSGGVNFYFPQDLYQMQIKENLIFDKQRSRMYYDVHAVTMLVPSDHPANVKGIEIPVASFAYRDLIEKVFKDNPNAIWYNPQNDAQHKSLADAFELRLFSSYIIKVSNPMDAYLVDIYGGDQVKGIMASQWAAFELLEYEHNLWEF